MRPSTRSAYQQDYVAISQEMSALRRRITDLEKQPLPCAHQIGDIVDGKTVLGIYFTAGRVRYRMSDGSDRE